MNDHLSSKPPVLLRESTADDFETFSVPPVPVPKALPSIPTEFSIRGEMTTVRNQGTQGSCASFAALACLENIHQRDLSEAQVQHVAETKYGNCEEGLPVVRAFQVCNKPGAVDEKDWPYDQTKVCWTEPPTTSGKTHHSFLTYAYIYRRPRSQVRSDYGGEHLSPTVMEALPLTGAIQRQLFARRRPVCVSVPVVWTAWPNNGNIKMPTPKAWRDYVEKTSPLEADGWHAVAICGWSSSSGRFTFKNSWDTTWGNSGYGTIPYQYVERYSDIGIIGW